jgi:tRNA(Ile)-lysidine synthase TilS/MesJ
MKDLTATEKRINSKIGKAIHDYSLISDGDRILVAVSGGKDSLALILLLDKIRKWAPVKFSLVAAHIISDTFPEDKRNTAFLTGLFKKLGLEYRIKKISLSGGKTAPPGCFWCSWNRRKALFELADELSCNKVALGHHKDDIAETMLMNLIYNGEISAMNPKQELFNGKIVIIRPLCYVEEKMTRKLASEMGFKGKTCTCPVSDSKRKFIKDFLERAEKTSRGMNIRTNIIKSLVRIKKEYLNIKEETPDL